MLKGQVCRKPVEGRRLTDLTGRHNDKALRKSKSVARVTFKKTRGNRLKSVDTRAQCPGPKHAKPCAADSVRGTQ